MRSTAWIAMGTLSTAACAGVWGFADLNVGDGGLEGDATIDGSGSGSGGSSGSSSGSGGCASKTVDQANGVFVAVGGADGGTCGNIGAPCGSVQQGINRAQLGKSIVYVGAGKYVESISLNASLTIEGGWTAGSTWTPICTSSANAAVVLQAPASSNTTVLADAIGGTATLRSLTIASKTQASVQPSESLYGVFARGSSTKLVLDDVVVRLGPAGTAPPVVRAVRGPVRLDVRRRMGATVCRDQPATQARGRMGACSLTRGTRRATALWLAGEAPATLAQREVRWVAPGRASAVAGCALALTRRGAPRVPGAPVAAAAVGAAAPLDSVAARRSRSTSGERRSNVLTVRSVRATAVRVATAARVALADQEATERLVAGGTDAATSVARQAVTTSFILKKLGKPNYFLPKIY